MVYGALEPVSVHAVFVHTGHAAPSQAADDGSRYAAIWEKTSGPDFVARHGMTSDAYQQEFDKWVKQGFRLTLVNGY
jgi:hypothetical protein